MKALITGVTGFAGSHLAEHLLSEGDEVYGICRWRSKTDNIAGVSGIHLLNGDIRDATCLRRILSEVNPDAVYHLAAQSFVLESWNSPLETLTTNVLGTAALLEAARACSHCVVHVAGSSEEYGLIDKIPITESFPLRPQSPYAVSKVACDLLAQQYYRSFCIRTVVTRAFNHTGPRRGEVFVTSTFAKQIAEIEKGKQPVIKVGNLDARRDFSDVRDIVRAYRLAVLRCRYGEPYNVCSGVARKVSEVLDLLLSLSKVKNIRIERDANRMRPSDVPILLGDCSKFRKETGWKPTYLFGQTMLDLLNYWRERC